jgi:hypothetical protein
VTEKAATGAGEKARARVRSLIISGDDRLKQGGPVQARKARESYQKALKAAESAGLADDLIRTLLERRIADCRVLELEPGGETAVRAKS